MRSIFLILLFVSSQFVKAWSQSIDQIQATEVLVIGGTASGICAGLQSSRLGVKTIIADRRVTAANLQWYFYQNPISVTVYDNDNYPSNHFELKYNYNSDSPSPIIALTQIPEAPDITGIEWIGLVGDSSQKISKNKNRNYFFYLGRN